MIQTALLYAVDGAQETVEIDKVAKIVDNALTSDFMLQVMAKV